MTGLFRQHVWVYDLLFFFFFFFKQKTAYEMLRSLVGSEMCIRDRNCVDYVTERLVNAFHAGVVPIVDGPPDYSLYAPTNRSVIQADQFKSVAELAEYLKFLDRNDDAYLEYLSHKRHGLGEHFRRVWLRDRREQPWHWGCLCRRAQRDLREQSNSVQASHVLPDLGCRPAGKWTHLRD
eukprot:TRINITY_DN7840_c0_g1_i3.p1 TRINITY_DN7840_c0_g1~~TRINITY_DN7840_c0_g1_i3.p1  ORF type:complete len:179 (+),score=51.00 TRINITY_DN7840_c0_g1_i3:1-537(+)